MAAQGWAPCMEAYRLYLGANGRSPKTIRWQICILGRYAAFCVEHGLDPALPDGIISWLSSLNSCYSRQTFRSYFLVARSFFRWMGAADVFADLKPPSVKRPPSKPYNRRELRRLLSAASDHRERAMIIVLLSTGMRAAELVAMRTEDVDWDVGYVRIRGKGDKVRRVALGSFALQALRDYVRRRRPRSYLWPARGQPTAHMRADSLYHLIQRLGERAGVAGACPHRFRHTFAHQFLEAGGNVGDLQVLLGHSSVRMSLEYAAYFQADRALAACVRLSPGDRLFLRPERSRARI